MSAARAPRQAERQFRNHVGLVTKVMRDKWPGVYRHLTPADRSGAGSIQWRRDAPQQKRDVSTAPEPPTDDDAGVYGDRARVKHWHDDDWQERDQERLDGSQEYDRARDFFREGERGLWRAVQTFDQSRRVKFSTWAYRCIEWAIRDYVRQGVKARDDAREPTVYEPEQELPATGVEDLLAEFPWRIYVHPLMTDLHPCDDVRQFDAGVEDELIGALGELDPVHAAIVRGRLGITRDEWGDWQWFEPSKSQAAIARELGLTRRQVQTREVVAMAAFRRELARRFRVLGLIY